MSSINSSPKVNSARVAAFLAMVICCSLQLAERASAQTETPLVESGALWSYLDDGSNPP